MACLSGALDLGPGEYLAKMCLGPVMTQITMERRHRSWRQSNFVKLIEDYGIFFCNGRVVCNISWSLRSTYSPNLR